MRVFGRCANDVRLRSSPFLARQYRTRPTDPWAADVKPTDAKVADIKPRGGRPPAPVRVNVVNKAPRECLTNFWTPTGGVTLSQEDQNASQALLAKAGFIRQSNSGIFHLLPLGLRVQGKIEKLIDKHMRRLGASKVSLSSVTSETLWTKSGRFSPDGKGQSELYRLTGGRDATGFLMSPTHEEEITELVGSSIKSHKELPIRLYQISRKYRNELRPRQGLLRAREFLMKDLYTFDLDQESAMETYQDVRKAYAAFFDELQLPYLTAEADSGNMGGNLSHEYHYATDIGEDNVISCNSCSYVANEEMAVSRVDASQQHAQSKYHVFIRITKGSKDLVLAFVPQLEGKGTPLNWHALKAAVPSLAQDIADPTRSWITSSPEQNKLEDPARHIYIIADYRIEPTQLPVTMEKAMQTIKLNAKDLIQLRENMDKHNLKYSIKTITHDPSTDSPLNLLSIQPGDSCPRCDIGTLNVQKAVELGHTFYLGTRYSEPLGCTVGLPHDDPRFDTTVGHRVPLEMGCHGIGVSRLIGAVASIMADDSGLNWPRVIAPFEVVVLAAEGFEKEGRRLYNVLDNVGLDVVADDRLLGWVWKMKDADMAGYPVILIVSKRSWGDNHSVEVQCRRLGYKKNHRTQEEDVAKVVRDLLDRL